MSSLWRRSNSGCAFESVSCDPSLDRTSKSLFLGDAGAAVWVVWADSSQAPVWNP